MIATLPRSVSPLPRRVAMPASCATLVLLALLATPAGADAPAVSLDDTLARVGSRVITAGDLVRRIEWMPWSDKQGSAGLYSAKVRALESLVGEQLLAIEAAREGLGDTGRIAGMRAGLERALVRDALYRREIVRHPPVSDARVNAALRRRGGKVMPAERATVRLAVRDSLQRLDEKHAAEAFMLETLRPQRAAVDSATFILLADSLHALMLRSRDGRATADGYALRPDDVDALLSVLEPELDRPLVRLPGAPLTLGAALEDLRFYVIRIHSLAPRAFAVELSRLFRGVVEGELMAREGLKRGLAADPEVRRDLAMWVDSWRAQMLVERRAGEGPPERRAERVSRYIGALAETTRIAIDSVTVLRVDILPQNMLTKRLLGFGGGMLAAPSLPPIWPWIRLWHAPRP